MEIWQFNDSEPLRPFLQVLENHAPHHLADCARRLHDPNATANRADLVRLAQGLVDDSASVRQAVRVLIFSPPVEEELNHFRRLLRWLPDWLPPAWHQDALLRRLVAELASSTDNRQSCHPLATLLQIALKQRLRSWRQEAALLPALWQPPARRLLLSMLARRLPYPLKTGLRNRLLEKKLFSLGQIYEAFAAANRLSPMGFHRYWRKMLLLAKLSGPAMMSPSPHRTEGSCLDRNLDLRIISWGQRRSEEIAFMERLISYQTNELFEVSSLAREVSQRTRRVVLTLHNASLGAASGWGIPAFAQQLPDEISLGFVERVNALRRNFSAKLSYHCQSVKSCNGTSLKAQTDNLFRLWGKRLVGPRLLQDLWALRVSLFLNGLPLEEWEQLLGQSRKLLGDANYQRLTSGKGLSVTFASPASSRQRLHETLSWYQNKKKSHSSLLSLLWGLIVAGEEELRKERIPYLVLPIIDKFFISSQRDQDLDYLPLFVQLVSRMSNAPLFFLIDDTSRATHPSLQLAMDRWRQHHAFLGLGIFAGESNPTASPLESILACSSQINLFALRPLTQVHNRISLDTLLTQRPQDFLTPEEYDSSWKDNLPFLYHSTQVAPLAGPVRQRDEFSPALTASAGPMAFGTYYRCRLRQLALRRLGLPGKKSQANDTQSPLELLWSEYAQLANLL
jgi:hypothetical protein